MLTSVQEQKMALAAYAAENSNIKQFSSHQLDIIMKIIEILALIANLSSITIVIPYLCILTWALEKNTDDSGVRIMKGELLHSLKLRFSRIEENRKLSVATY